MGEKREISSKNGEKREGNKMGVTALEKIYFVLFFILFL